MKNTILKKILLVSLSVLMCLNTVVTVNAAKETDYSKDIDFLKMMGIVDNSLEVDKFLPDTALTRAEFAGYFARFLNLAYSNTKTLYYNDVPDTHYAFGEITALTEKGYFKGVGNKTFNPEGEMRIEYTYNLFATALGAGEIVKFKSNDNNAALSVCEELDITDGVKSTYGPLTEGDLFKMMANALTSKTYGLDKPNGSITLSNRTILESTRGMIYVKEGAVTTIGAMSINNVSVNDGYMVIGEDEYLVPDFDVDTYIGRKVEYIYKKSPNDQDEKQVVWMNALKGSDVLDIEVTPECSFNLDTRILRYYDEEDHEKKVEIPTGITLIYNGEYKGRNVNEVFSMPRFSLRLIKNNTKEYSIAIVKKADYILVDSINYDEMKVIDRLTSKSFSLDPEDYDTIKIIGTSGYAFDLKAIAKNNLLSIYKSDSGRYVSVVVSSYTASGEIEATKSGEIKIDGEFYEYYDPDYKLPYKLGQNVVAYLTNEGYVLFVEKAVDKNDTVAYLIKCSYDEETEKISFRFLLPDNTFVTYEAANRITVNEASFNNKIEKAFNALKDGAAKVIPQIVKYKLNNEKQVTLIEFASEDDGKDHELYIDDKLVQRSGDSEASYSYMFSFKAGRQMGINSDTVIFNVPEPDSNYEVDEQYCFVGYPGNGIHPSVVSYRTTKEPAFFEQYIVYTVAGGSGAGKMSVVPAMYDSSYSTVNKDDESVTMLVMYSSSGSRVEYQLVSGFDFKSYNLRRGDIINYKVNPLTNEINAIEHVCGPTKTASKNGWTEFTAENRILYANLYSIEDGGVRLGYETGTKSDEIIIWNGSVVYYDREKDKVFVGVANDLKPGKVYGDDCSIILTTSTYGSTNGMFALK